MVRNRRAGAVVGRAARSLSALQAVDRPCRRQRNDVSGRKAGQLRQVDLKAASGAAPGFARAGDCLYTGIGIFKCPMNISGKCTVFTDTPAYFMDEAGPGAVPGLHLENAASTSYRATRKLKNY